VFAGQIKVEERERERERERVRSWGEGMRTGE